MRTTLLVDGMRTVHCVRALSTALGGVPGIMRAHVRLGVADLDHEGTLDADLLREAVEVAGYSLRELTVSRALPIKDG